MAEIKTILDEMREGVDRISAVVALARKEDRELSAEEETEVTSIKARLDDLASKRKREDDFSTLLASVHAMRPPVVAPPSTGNGHAPGIVVPGFGGPIPPKSLGAQFVEHALYAQMIKGAQRGGQWQSPSFELQAAGVTLVPAGAAIPPGTVAPVPYTYPLDWSVAGRFAQGTVDGGMIPYMRETVWTNAAAAVAMGAPKPQSTKELTLVQQPLVKIAHYVDVPDELLDDVEGLRSFLDAQMAAGVIEKLESEIINGSGAAGQIQGILTLPGKAPNVAFTTGTYIASLLAQRAQIYELSRLRPDTVVMSPATWALVLTQTSQSGGLLFPPQLVIAGAPVTLAGMAIIEAPSVPDGTAIVGAFRQGGQLYRKGGVVVQATNSHGTNFVSNITSIRAEIRAAVAYYRTTAFGLVTGLDTTVLGITRQPPAPADRPREASA